MARSVSEGKQSVNGARSLVDALHGEGLTTVFGIPGVDTLAVYDAFIDRPEVRTINVRHEQSAVFMADGYARSSGRIAVALTSGGPGALNTLTAMATAFNDGIGLLHVVNENPAHVRQKGRGYFHDLRDQMGIFRPVTDFTAQPRRAAEIGPAIGAAMYALRSRRPRPAMVEIGGEAFTESCDAVDFTPTAWAATATGRLRPRCGGGADSFGVGTDDLGRRWRGRIGGDRLNSSRWLNSSAHR